MQGNLVLTREHEQPVQDTTPVLVLSVSGDSLLAITRQISRDHFDRPLALDLLWKVTAQGWLAAHETVMKYV